MEIGNKKAKYAVHIHTEIIATKYVGTVYCDTEEEYYKLLDDNEGAIYDEGNIIFNASNDVDISDIYVSEIDSITSYMNELDK